jgi:hypothetical protein
MHAVSLEALRVTRPEAVGLERTKPILSQQADPVRSGHPEQAISRETWFLNLTPRAVMQWTALAVGTRLAAKRRQGLEPYASLVELRPRIP